MQPLSPLDGRYRAAVADLGNYLSEAGLNRARVLVEVEWLIHLANRDLLGTNTPIDLTEAAALRAIVTNFGDDDVATLAATEATTKHDVKAVEYFIRGKLSELGREDLLELTHFACTSEDINNLSYAITVRDAVAEAWLPRAEKLMAKLRELSAKYIDAAMMSRTHGQPATPTTMGKELAVFVHRLQRQLDRIKGQQYLGKFSGATGTFSAHVVAAPGADWAAESEAFVSSLGLTWNPLTTQIESHDWQAELYGAVGLFNRILHNLCTDIWTYISLAYFKQIPVAGATGSSTMGKEIAVFVHRLERQVKRIQANEYLGKFSGATGTFSAHVVAAPNVNWPKESEDFVTSLGLTWNPLTTQIESHDWQAELYSAVSLFNGILHNLCTDIWTYISLAYFKQIPVAGATGSSTMPHKINPIRFENAESNLELSCAILDSLAATLVTSRLQRDLTDSSSQRNIGLGFGHSLLAIDNVTRGLGEIELSPAVLDADLSDNWEVLGEAIQTVIRAEVAAGRSNISDPYALLKELTRGKRVGHDDLAVFVNELDISQDAKDRLLALRPHTYVGIAAELGKRVQ